MKNRSFLFSILILSIFISQATLLANDKVQDNFSFGIHFMSGIRYDNMRMCVASDAGVKGGPMADIMLSTKYKLNDKYALTFNLPVMRPILFASAFKMLQFEPEINLLYTVKFTNAPDLVLGPGLGISAHYGPDYRSDMDNKSDSFYGAGPIFSGSLGLGFNSFGDTKSIAGIRCFYIPLFTKNNGTGTVLGVALEYTLYF